MLHSSSCFDTQLVVVWCACRQNMAGFSVKSFFLFFGHQSGSDEKLAGFPTKPFFCFHVISGFDLGKGPDISLRTP